MNEEINSKELKILADILALVLEEQEGQSQNALQTLKKRAKKDMVTGGALKNLFNTIAINPPKQKNTNKPKAETTDTTIKLLHARTQLTKLTNTIDDLDATIKSLQRHNETLRSELILKQKSRVELEAALYVAESKASFRSTLIIASILFGLFCGIAGTVVVHSISPPPRDNTIYLH